MCPNVYCRASANVNLRSSTPARSGKEGHARLAQASDRQGQVFVDRILLGSGEHLGSGIACSGVP